MRSRSAGSAETGPDLGRTSLAFATALACSSGVSLGFAGSVFVSDAAGLAGSSLATVLSDFCSSASANSPDPVGPVGRSHDQHQEEVREQGGALG